MIPILVGVAAIFFVVLICVVKGVRGQAAFEEKFPPISDAEFLARCRPGTDPAVALKVRRIIAEHLAVEYERVHPSSRFVDDLGAD
jgi:hypothetical protein